MSDYRNSHTRPGYGASYSKQFENNPYRSLIWKLEQIVLDKIFTKFFSKGQINHLDFACGTGRILVFFKEKVSHTIGVDISPSMLEIVYNKFPEIEIIEADLTKNDVLGNKKFNLITAFRFFPNAELQLRKEVMEILTTHLASDGYIIFNNHKNYSSLIGHISRITKRDGNDGMKKEEVIHLISSFGLKIEKIYHIGLIPSTEKRLFLPRHLLFFIEKLAMNFGILRYLSQNLIYVCNRSV